MLKCRHCGHNEAIAELHQCTEVDCFTCVRNDGVFEVVLIKDVIASVAKQSILGYNGAQKWIASHAFAMTEFLK